MTMPIWETGDGTKTVETDVLRREYIYDRINQEMLAAGISSQAEVNAMLAYLGYSAGASRGGDTFGFFSFGDSGAVGAVVINDVTCVPGYDIESEPNITSLSWPNLISIDPTNLQAGYLYIQNNPLLTSVSMPVLTSGIWDFFLGNNAALTTVDLPVYVPPNTSNFQAPNCALDVASVDHILAIHVANPAYVAGVIVLTGGTNAPPGPQGLLDVATLIGRGVAVGTN